MQLIMFMRCLFIPRRACSIIRVPAPLIAAAMLDGLKVLIGEEEQPLSAVAQVSVRDAATLALALHDAAVGCMPLHQRLMLPSTVCRSTRRCGRRGCSAARRATDRCCSPCRCPSQRCAARTATHARRWTAEFRQRVVKHARESAEKFKGRVRQTRAKALKAVKEVSAVSKDDVKRMETLVRAAPPCIAPHHPRRSRPSPRSTALPSTPWSRPRAPS